MTSRKETLIAHMILTQENYLVLGSLAAVADSAQGNWIRYDLAAVGNAPIMIQSGQELVFRLNGANVEIALRKAEGREA